MQTLQPQKIGYIRVSTVEQSDERQLEGIELNKVFKDQRSGRDKDRPGFQQMMEFVREGDELYVHDISRLARNVGHLLEIVETLNKKGVGLHFVKEGLHFKANMEADPMTKLMLQVMGSVYEFERRMLLERQREGIEIAKKQGKYAGGKRRVDRQAILQALNHGSSIRETAKLLGISVSTVQRVKKEAEDTP